MQVQINKEFGEEDKHWYLYWFRSKDHMSSS